MSLMKSCCVALLTALVTACGGGGSSTSATSFSFVAPQVNSQRIYTQTIIDNSANTITESISDTTISVHSDGSYVVLQDDPNNNSVTVNGTTYSVTTETVTVNNAGQEVSFTYTPSGGSLTTCAYAPHGAGPNYPIVIGQTWSLTYTLTCGSSAPISYSQTGSVIDIESVTVPAGTYSAVKLQSTITWTGLNGTAHTNVETNWRDVNTGISVKWAISHTYGGTVQSNGYPVTTATVLQSGVP